MIRMQIQGESVWRFQRIFWSNGSHEWFNNNAKASQGFVCGELIHWKAMINSITSVFLYFPVNSMTTLLSSSLVLALLILKHENQPFCLLKSFLFFFTISMFLFQISFTSWVSFVLRVCCCYSCCCCCRCCCCCCLWQLWMGLFVWFLAYQVCY